MQVSCAVLFSLNSRENFQIYKAKIAQKLVENLEKNSRIASFNKINLTTPSRDSLNRRQACQIWHILFNLTTPGVPNMARCFSNARKLIFPRGRSFVDPPLRPYFSLNFLMVHLKLASLRHIWLRKVNLASLPMCQIRHVKCTALCQIVHIWRRLDFFFAALDTDKTPSSGQKLNIFGILK